MAKDFQDRTKGQIMAKCKCQHEWEYFDILDYPNGYEYDEVIIPQRSCKKWGE